MPRLDAKFEPAEMPPGLLGTLGRAALLELPPARLRVAMAVGKTKEGSELPAQPAFVKPVPLSLMAKRGKGRGYINECHNLNTKCIHPHDNDIGVRHGISPTLNTKLGLNKILCGSERSK